MNNLWQRFRDGLGRTRERLQGQVGGLLGLKGEVDEATRERLEEALLDADVGPGTAERLIENARLRMGREPGLDLEAALEAEAAALTGARRASFAPGPERPWVALIIGVNGAGKTTLAGKLAASF